MQQPISVSFLLHFGTALAFTGAYLVAEWVSEQRAELVVYEFPVQVVQTKPKPVPKIKPAEKPKPQKLIQKEKAVFGASTKSLTTSDEAAPTVKSGNTIAKTPDNKILDKDEDLPIPVEEYLVSEMPRLIEEIRVPYPPEAKENGIEGRVVMDILIDQKGSIREANLVEGPGYGLNEAALEAIKKFRFKPATVDGKAVAVRIRYVYNFVLE